MTGREMIVSPLFSLETDAVLVRIDSFRPRDGLCFRPTLVSTTTARRPSLTHRRHGGTPSTFRNQEHKRLRRWAFWWLRLAGRRVGVGAREIRRHIIRTRNTNAPNASSVSRTGPPGPPGISSLQDWPGIPSNSSPAPPHLSPA